MQAQKFDPTKSHGVIYGHPEALYEQGGNLYTGEGRPTGASKTKAPSVDTSLTIPPSVDTSLTIPEDGVLSDPIQIFLTSLLSGGPVMQVNIRRECEKEGLDWSDVLNISSEMNITKAKKGAMMMWQLVSSDDVQESE